jgi:hypothetical protein
VCESFNHLDVYLFLCAFTLFYYLAFVIFKIINFLAILSMHVCPVA